MSTLDLTNKIERMEITEERAGIRLDALYAVLDLFDDEGGDGLTVSGEIHAADQSELLHDITLVMGCYDSKGRLVIVDDLSIWKDDFYVFDSFRFIENHLDKAISRDISRIRIHAKVRT